MMYAGFVCRLVVVTVGPPATLFGAAAGAAAAAAACDDDGWTRLGRGVGARERFGEGGKARARNRRTKTRKKGGISKNLTIGKKEKRMGKEASGMLFFLWPDVCRSRVSGVRVGGRGKVEENRVKIGRRTRRNQAKRRNCRL
ncbi:hypothetical protein B0T13DRAFT_58429 [Neurospora crassa]|nr:hypothetical protein B0T13DRAFT_58429 [Neurospora crassa]